MTVGDKIPLRFDFYSNNAPSALAEFTASDVVGVSNGGTGASSLADFGTSLSQTNVSANAVSSVNFFTPDAGAFNCMGADGEKFFMKRENGASYENLIR